MEKNNNHINITIRKINSPSIDFLVPQFSGENECLRCSEWVRIKADGQCGNVYFLPCGGRGWPWAGRGDPVKTGD